MTDGNKNNVRLRTISNNSKDILFSIHVHNSFCLFSSLDLMRCISNKNNLKFEGIVTSDEILIIQSKGEVIRHDDIKKILGEYKVCYRNAILDYYNYKKSFSYCLKKNFISSDLLNKYVNYYWWLK